MTTMNPKVKEKWLNALRSGEYSQTKEVLKNSEGFCCLGVLCDIYSKENDELWDDEDHLLGESGELPWEIAEWAGFAEKDPCYIQDEYDLESEKYVHNNENPQNPRILYTDEETKLSCNLLISELNDEYALSFDEISNYIEKQL